MTKRAQDASPEGEAVTFESCMERLESIVNSMENDRLPLGELLENYGQGVELLSKCQEMLDQAQQKIERITSGKSGLETRPFDPEAPEPPPTPSKPKSPKKHEDETRLL